MVANLTQELGELLSFTGRVGVAIRMYSAYAPESQPLNKAGAEDLMYLSDSIHDFDAFGVAIAGGDESEIERQCNGLISMYKHYLLDEPRAGMKGHARATFERNEGILSLRDGIGILERIHQKLNTENRAVARETNSETKLTRFFRE